VSIELYLLNFAIGKKYLRIDNTHTKTLILIDQQKTLQKGNQDKFNKFKFIKILKSLILPHKYNFA